MKFMGTCPVCIKSQFIEIAKTIELKDGHFAYLGYCVTCGKIILRKKMPDDTGGKVER